MSGVFGILNRNSKAIENETVETLQKAMSYWKPDEEYVWVDGPVALGHGMLWNTPESKYEHLPLKEDAYVLTMDARIDNRDELAKEIELPDRPLSQIGDSEFILGAYKKWGEECPKHLLGDFAFAIWDEKKQQLFCVRDHVGVKQFYYHLSDDLFLFGNDLKVLTQYPDISQKINDEAVANYIANNQLLSNKITFFEDIIKLPPAHTLVISHSIVELKCYWRLEDAPKIKLPNAEAYAKKLRELLEEAVYARMRSNYPITSHLSGGLDSSTIAVLAARKLKEKGEKLLAFNWLHEPTKEDDPVHDEWTNSKQIAEIEGIDHYYISLHSDDIYNYLQKREVAFGDTTTFWYEYQIREEMQKRNSRSLLTGWGGDEVCTYHGQSFYSDMFVKGKWNTLYHELKVKLLKTQKLKSKISFIYYHLFILLMPRSFYCFLPKVKCVKKSYPFIHKWFVENINKITSGYSLVSQPNKTIREHKLAFWNNKHLQSRIESWASTSYENKLEYSYPLMDKRILEFSMCIPSEYYIKDGKGRHIYRQAIKDLLPSNILSIQKAYEKQRVEYLVKTIFIPYKTIAMEYILADKMRNKYIDLNGVKDFLREKDTDRIFLEKLEHLETIDTILTSNFLKLD